MIKTVHGSFAKPCIVLINCEDHAYYGQDIWFPPRFLVVWFFYNIVIGFVVIVFNLIFVFIVKFNVRVSGLKWTSVISLISHLRKILWKMQSQDGNAWAAVMLRFLYFVLDLVMLRSMNTRK
jgi:hypothetical protein